MQIPAIGTDPMDIFSQPVNITNTKLSRIFERQIRDNPEKPGRTLKVIWDNREPLIPGFINRYSYLVTFKGKGELAGNHYHEHKEELFTAVSGDFKIILENPKTKYREELALHSSIHQTLYIPANTAHVVIAESENAVLLVTASFPGTISDEFPYHLV